MPELPEVETVRRGLAPVFEGARFSHVELRRPNLRFPFPEGFVERLEGRYVEALSRRAKYLVAALDSGESLVMHLGMSGSFRIEHDGTETPGAFHHERSKAPAHDHVAFTFESGARVVYNDPRRFGYMVLIEAGGSTLRDHRQADGALGYFQHAFEVYDREGAACQHAGCKGTIARFVQGGRSTFWCGVCQK